MARHANRLTVRGIAAENRPGMYSDGGSLYLQVARGGSKSWIYRFMLNGKSRDMGLGGIDVVLLSEAREKALEARKMLKDGIDPIERRIRQRAQVAVDAATAKTFRFCAESYIEGHKAEWRSAKHGAQWRKTLETYAYPIFGDLPVNTVDTAMVTRVIEPIWTTKTETATRLRGRIEAVLDWAKVREYRTGENPARWRGHLSNLLPKPSKVSKIKHHAALPFENCYAFTKALRERDAVAARGLEFLILTAARPGEVTGARWDEVDIDKAVWTIPGDRMKAGEEHRVPLSPSAVAVLRKMEKVRISDYVFPGQRDGRSLWTDSMRRLLERMNYAGLTTHGFRSTFRDWTAERT
ncbi:MAG: integrase arm-type DNA-binding domain-containing protein, partial [Alphaproteobacteria bacterium]